MTRRFFAVVNPAAGGGRSGRLADSALDRVRALGIDLEVARTAGPGDATALARAAYAQGHRNFLAVGGDGTSYEILNGIFPQALAGGDRVALAMLPLGTGNSFLKDFTSRGVEHTLSALAVDKSRRCDVIRLSHSDGDIYFLNLVSLGFPADVGALTNRRFKRLGELGYILGVFTQLARLEHRAFPHRLDAAPDWDSRPCLFLSFSNSKFTGGKMMIAPDADPTDGKIEYVRWSPVSRTQLVWLFPRLFTGTHIRHPRASRASARRIELDLGGPVDALVDGEILRLNCRSLEILPGALDVFA
ncbi:MAG TPA: diacylglycerol kinase family protein [Candidatus Limnocylindrales bacterium]|nr:diacylglycerol kinase family protein [Candidatus Limnocylindrales bacterium]